MTRGIPDPAARARTTTVYTDVQKVLENPGLAGTDTIAVLVVERGAVSWPESSAASSRRRPSASRRRSRPNLPVKAAA